MEKSEKGISMAEKRYYFYFMSNFTNTTLYAGMTGNLDRRMLEHKEGRYEGFSKTYRTKKLVYVEEYHDVNEAIAREKQIKHWRRAKKDALINSLNPEWKDLFTE